MVGAESCLETKCSGEINRAGRFVSAAKCTIEGYIFNRPKVENQVAVYLKAEEEINIEQRK